MNEKPDQSPPDPLSWVPWHWTASKASWVMLFAAIIFPCLWLVVMKWTWRNSDWVMEQPWFPILDYVLDVASAILN